MHNGAAFCICYKAGDHKGWGMFNMAECKEEELQDIHPETMLLAAELLGNLSSLKMPFNVQNLIGNWLMLVGQIILVFNAQQQFWQNGPGHYYSCCNKNIGNTMMPDNGDTKQRTEQYDRQSMQEELKQLRSRIDQIQQVLEEKT